MGNRHAKKIRRHVFQVHRDGTPKRHAHPSPHAEAEPRRPCMGERDLARYATATKDAATNRSTNHGTRHGQTDTFESPARTKRTASNRCCMRTHARLESGDRPCELANRAMFVGKGARHKQSVQLRQFALRCGRKTDSSGAQRIPHQERGIHEELASDAGPYATENAVRKELEATRHFRPDCASSSRPHSPAGRFTHLCLHLPPAGIACVRE